MNRQIFTERNGVQDTPQRGTDAMNGVTTRGRDVARRVAAKGGRALALALALLLAVMAAAEVGAQGNADKNARLQQLGFTLTQPEGMSDPSNPYGRGTKNLSPVLELMISTPTPSPASTLFTQYDMKRYGNLSGSPTMRNDNIANIHHPHRLFSGDFLGNGKRQVVALLEYNLSTHKIWLRFIDATNGTVYSDGDMEVRAAATAGFAGGGAFGENEIWGPKVFLAATVGDFNGDGREEVAVYTYYGQQFRIYFFGFNNETDRTIRPRGWQEIGLPTDIFKVGTFNGKRDYTTARMAAGDLNGDGLDDLVVVANYHNRSQLIGNNTNDYASRLLIYYATSQSGTLEFALQPEKPVLKVKNNDMDYGDSYNMRDVSVAIGDINGDGVNEIVVGGLLTKGWDYVTRAAFGGTLGWAYSYNAPVGAIGYFNGNGRIGAGYLTGGEYQNAFTYSKTVQSTDRSGERIRGMLSNAPQITGTSYLEYSFPNTVNPPVALTAFKEDGVGMAESVFMDGAIFKLDINGRFEFKTPKNNLFSFYFPGWGSGLYVHDYSGTWVDEVIAGNFTNDKTGKENVIFVCASPTRSGNIGGDIVGSNGSWSRRAGSLTRIRSIAPVDYDNDGLMVRYTGRKDYYFTDPHVVAVLQAAPYFNRLNDGFYEYAGSTDISFSQGSGTTHTESFSVSAALIVGAEVKGSFFGLFESGIEMSQKFTAKMGYEYESSSMKTYSTEISSPSDEDRVALTMIPYTRYHYEMYVPEQKFLTQAEHNKNVSDYNNYLNLLKTMSINDTKYAEYADKAIALKQIIDVTEELRKTYNWGATIPVGYWDPYAVSAPSTPKFTVITVDKYDEVAEIFGTPTIRGNVLPANYRLGYPETYRQNSTGLVDVDEGRNPVGGAAGNWVTVSVGGLSTVKQAIDMSTSKSHGITWGASWDLEVVLTTVHAKAGFAIGVEYEGGHAWVTTKGSTYSGSVSNMPQGTDPAFTFDWRFLTHRATLNGVKVPVLEYLTRGVNKPLDYQAVIAPERHTFPETPANHPSPPAQQFTLTNKGNGGFANLTATLEGTGSSAFEISTPLSAGNLAVNGTVTLSVRPKTTPVNAPQGDHSANLVIRHGTNNTVLFTIPLTVKIIAPQFTTVYVTATGFGRGDGENWANSYQGLQRALDAASRPGSIITEIRVAQGTYTPSSPAGDGTGLRDMAFVLPAGVRVLGGYNAGNDTRNPTLYPTTLSGDIGSGVIACHVVIATGDMKGAILDGFTVKDGAANGTGSITVGGRAVERNYGGGIYVAAGNLTVSNCIITGNSATTTGGAIMANGQNGGCNTTFLQCLITSNTSGLHNHYATARFVNCTFANNGSSDVQVFWAWQSNTVVINSILTGPMRIFDGASKVGSPDVRHSIINGKYYVNTDESYDVSTAGLFVSAPTDLRLGATSAALNRGLNTVDGVTMPANDFGGSSRIIAGVIDLGAYEYQTVALTPLIVRVFPDIYKVTLMAQTPETGYTFHYASSATPVAAPAYNSPIGTPAAYSAQTSIDGGADIEMFVQVYKVTNPGGLIVGFGEASATPISGLGGTLKYTTTITIPQVNGFNPYKGALANPAPADAGGTVTLPAIVPADIETGFAFKEWQVAAGGVTLASDASGVWSFVMGSEQVAVRAVFEASALTFGNITLADGVYGTAYSAAITPATGGSGTFTYAATVPAGLTMSSDGKISGTPNAVVTAAVFTVTAIDAMIGTTATANYTLTIAKANQTLMAGNISKVAGDGAVDLDGHARSSAGAGGGVITYSVTAAGTTGATLSGDMLSFVTAGTATITASAAGDANHNAASITFTLTVSSAPVAPAITSASFATVGSAGGTFQVTATGTTPLTYSLDGTEPAGVTIDAVTGLLSVDGAVVTNGVYTFDITAANGAGSDAQTFTLTVEAAQLLPPSITSPSGVMVGSNGGTFRVTASGTQPFTFSLSGAVPSGVTIDGGTGLMTVSSSVAPSVYRFTVKVSNGIGNDATQEFSLAVSSDPLDPPVFTSAASASVQFGAGGTFQVVATGDLSMTYSLSGAPAGVSISSTSGLLSFGSAVAAGVHTFVVTASNGVGSPVTQTFTLTVIPPVVITSGNGASVVTGTGGTFQVLASGDPVITFSLDGTQPAGVSISAATGLMTFASSVPAGVYTFTITASNGIGADGMQSFTLTVTAASTSVVPGSPAIAGPTSMILTVGYTATSTGAYSITGASPVNVSKTSGDARITWNNTNKCLDIAAGLPVGVYKVELTASNVAGSAKLTFTLTVEKKVFYLDIPRTFAGGKVDAFSSNPNPYLACEGDTVTLTITPDDGYVLDTVYIHRFGNPNLRIPLLSLVRTRSLALTGPVVTCTFVMPADHVTVVAVFKSASVSVEDIREVTDFKAYVQNGMLYVSGMSQSSLRVYNSLGTLVFQGITPDGKAEIPLPGRGVYMVTDGKETVKVMN